MMADRPLQARFLVMHPKTCARCPLRVQTRRSRRTIGRLALPHKRKCLGAAALRQKRPSTHAYKVRSSLSFLAPLRRSRIRNTIRRKTPRFLRHHGIEKCMPLQGTAALRRSCREISAMPPAIFKLHPPIILRGRWVTWLNAFSATRSPARRAKNGSET
jgi:hypothetical protein